MTLTFQGYDASPEVAAFFAKVKAAQGFVSAVKYRTNSTADYTAHVPEQPELIPCEHHLKNASESNALQPNWNSNPMLLSTKTNGTECLLKPEKLSSL